MHDTIYVPEKKLYAMSTWMHVPHGMEKAHHAQVINLHYSNIFKNRNLHCDIQQLPQLNPTHQAKEYQHLALSILNIRSLSIIKLTHNQYIILSMFWVLLLITGTTDICNIVFRGAWRGISWQTDTVKTRWFLLYCLQKCICIQYKAK